jgi:photosystem II stability/assembly factor-like uncharacterized protein
MRKSVNLLALAVAGLGLSYGTAQAQLNLTWEEIGPNNHGNHARALAVDASGNVWAGAVGGGLWKSTDRGSTWTQSGISENLNVSCIAADGNNIYVGTGESYFVEPSTSYIPTWRPDSVTTFRWGFFGYTGRPGQGVFVSNDGGATWSHNNGTWNASSVPYAGDFKSIQKVNAKGGRVLVASLAGLYYSDDNLATVTKSAGTSAFMTRTIMDMEFLGGNVVLAATRDSLYRSTDNGVTFGPAINSSMPLGTTAPNNRLGGKRIEIAVAPSNDNIAYATGSSDINGNCTGVFRTNDAGVTWTRIAPFESSSFQPFAGQGLYNLILGVHKTDPDAVVLGGRRLYRYSADNGWVTSASHTYTPGFSTNYVPRPQLVFAIDPSSDSTYYIGTDGEIVRTDNFGRTFSFKTKGFNAAHLNSIDPSPAWQVIVGDQYKGVLYKDNANSNVGLQQFTLLTPESEGGAARWCPTLPDHIVAQGPDGGLIRSFTVGTSFESFYSVPEYPFHPSFGVGPDSMIIDRPDTASGGGTLYDVGAVPVTPWDWDGYIAPSALGDDSLIMATPLTLYMASKSFVWVCKNPFGSIDSLPTWNRLTNDITAVNVGSGVREYITVLTSANDAAHTVWIGSNNGRIHRLDNANDPLNRDITTTVVRVDDPAMPRRWVSDIAVNPNNPNIVVVTYGSYVNGDDRVWITNNAMDAVPTWRSAAGNLPANLPVYSVAFHPAPSQTAIVIGTDEGIYGSNTNYNTVGNPISWTPEGGPIGKAAVHDVVFRRYFQDWIDNSNWKYSPDYTLFAATHGRGAFKSRSLVGTQEVSFNNSGIEVGLSPNPTNTQSTLQISLPTATRVKVEVYNLQGTQVAAVAEHTWNAGLNEMTLNTQLLPAGMYLVKTYFANGQGEFQHTLKQVVVK